MIRVYGVRAKFIHHMVLALTPDIRSIMQYALFNVIQRLANVCNDVINILDTS